MRYWTVMAMLLSATLAGCLHHGKLGTHHGCDSCGPSLPGGAPGPGGFGGFGGPGNGFAGGPGHGRHAGQGQAPPVYNLPPSQLLMHPGPGVDGPGPGVMSYLPVSAHGPVAVSQVRFAGPAGMHVAWQISPDGVFSEEPLVAPANMDFVQGAIYRLKLTHVPGRDGDTFYPTLEIGPTTPRTEAFLAHSKIPVQFTEADFAQVVAGNFVTKVIYLPDPEHQELAVAGGIEELVSTRLDPGMDPIVEADRKGTILAIIRMGNKDLEARGAAPRPRIKAMGYQGEEEVPPGAPLPRPVPEIGQPSTTPSFISGVTTVPYGMPYTGTPIGLPGPPHLPLGIPAGLKAHAIMNHTEHHIPRPVQDIQIHVKQSPGFSYPQPPNTMYLHERVVPGGHPPMHHGHP